MSKQLLNQRYIYKIKDSYSVQIKKKYYGCRKSLEDAIKLRNEKLKELQIQGETKCKWVYLKNKNQLIGIFE